LLCSAEEAEERFVGGVVYCGPRQLLEFLYEDRWICEVRYVFALELKFCGPQVLLTLGIDVLQYSIFEVEGEGRCRVVGDILKAYILLQLKESLSIILINSIFTDELGHELNIDIDHFEVNEFVFE
jgi:hypothetical protein